MCLKCTKLQSKNFAPPRTRKIVQSCKSVKTKEMLKFFFLLLAILFNIASADDYLFTFCSNSKNYTRNSTFENNLKQLLVSLPSNTSVTGFYNTSIGDHSSDQVYAQALCRGDVNSTICQACIEKAGQHILEQCKN